jgi:ADP-ribose pyrophosphatase YjhB (NUDIX family)
MCPGECKDRMGDAFDRFGRVPVIRRTRVASPEDPTFRSRSRAPFWAAGGLVHDRRGSIVLVRVGRESTAGRWFTPGGLLEPGERTDDGLRREVREEAGVDLTHPTLTRIIYETVTDGQRARHGYFAQFIAVARSTDLRAGHEVLEARWFDNLPPDMAFRDDYLEDFQKIRPGTTF